MTAATLTLLSVPELIADALAARAEYFRDNHGLCRDCVNSPTGMCQDREDDLARADAYDEALRRLEAAGSDGEALAVLRGEAA